MAVTDAPKTAAVKAAPAVSETPDNIPEGTYSAGTAEVVVLIDPATKTNTTFTLVNS